MNNIDSAEIDAAIERSLASYSAVEPLAGLDERILNRVHVSPKRALRFTWERSVAGLCLGAALFVAMFVAIAHRPRPDSVLITKPSAPSLRIAAKPETPLFTPVIRKRAGAVRPRTFVVRETAPKMTPTERGLLLFAGSHPEAALQIAAGLAKNDGRELEIEALNIPPLEIDSSQSGESK